MEMRVMELQHFSHRHPLVLVEIQSHEIDKAHCWGCGELISGPRFGCAECGFWLDKVCAEAPAEIDHPFHREHSLELLVSPPYYFHCVFCGERVAEFVYRCGSGDLGLELHIKCALVSKSIAERSFEDVPQKDALVSLENFPQNLNAAKCCACQKWLLDSAYLDLGKGILLHRKCVDLPLEINHFLHTPHSLILQFDTKYLPCQICQNILYRGFVYCCSPCKFFLHISCLELPAKMNHLCHRSHPLFLVQPRPDSLPCQICREKQDQGFVYSCSTSTCKISVHVDCLSPPPIIKGEIHQHPFTLLWRQASFICDACGTAGNCAFYICLKCSLIVHQGCISLPPILRFPRHRHRLSHTFVLGQHDEIETRKCEACPEEVNAEHGVYCCFDCNYIVHANCARRYIGWFDFDELELEDTDEQLQEKSAFDVIKETQHGEDTAVASEIKHRLHQHNLVLSDDSEGDKFCEGCFSSISTSFYYCSQCDFILHKSCADSPLKKYLWFHPHQRPLTLISADRVFRCRHCRFEFNSGFAYKCSMCRKDYLCLACALVSDTPTLQGHEHRLSYYEQKRGLCSGCGDELEGAFTCKDCDFAVDWKCLRLPNKIVHRCDDHPLMLTFDEKNLYSEYNYCDICEKRRDPKQCFYHCAKCNTSTHRECAVKSYSFMKLGGSYKFGNHIHSHRSLTFTHSIEACHVCHQLCLDLSLEFSDEGCDYIVHWDCLKHSLGRYFWEMYVPFIRQVDAGTS